MRILETEPVDRCPTFRLEPTILNYVGPRLIQVTDDQGLAKRINNFRYQIAAHLGPKLTRLADQASTGNFGRPAGKPQRIEDARNSILKHSSLLIADKAITDEIEARIKKLEAHLGEWALPDW